MITTKIIAQFYDFAIFAGPAYARETGPAQSRRK
jgi:hypothetical protein